MKVIEVSYLHLAAVSQPSDTQAKPKNLLSLPSAQIYLQRFFLFVIVSLCDQQLYYQAQFIFFSTKASGV